MRRCIKGFNFKLDFDEIDRIIEEEEEVPVKKQDELLK